MHQFLLYMFFFVFFSLLKLTDTKDYDLLMQYAVFFICSVKESLLSNTFLLEVNLCKIINNDAYNNMFFITLFIGFVVLVFSVLSY